MPAPSTVKQTEAYQLLVSVFNAAGDSALGQFLADAIYDDPTLVERDAELLLLIQGSEPYKKRFSGLDKIRTYNNTTAGKANPIPVMSEGEYLDAENAYKQILYPVKDLYGANINQTIGDLIGANVSAVEVQSRLGAAQQWANNANPAVKQALKEFYNINDSDLVAYALDPKTATVMIEKQAGITALAAEAYDTQVKITQGYSERMLEDLVRTGQARNLTEAGQIAAKELRDITTGTATGYNPAAGSLATVTKLAGIEGTELTGESVLGAALGTDTAAAGKVSGLKSRERARFSGTTGGTNVLGEQMSGNV
jgi:hypothetical protein